MAEVFNQPLLKYYAALPIAGLDTHLYGEEPIYYLVAEYSDDNSYGIDQWNDSWYIRRSDSVAGLLTDFELRHDPTACALPAAARALTALAHTSPSTRFVACIQTHACGVVRRPCFARAACCSGAALARSRIGRPKQQ